jgi:hypothetical protein
MISLFTTENAILKKSLDTNVRTVALIEKIMLLLG